MVANTCTCISGFTVFLLHVSYTEIGIVVSVPRVPPILRTLVDTHLQRIRDSTDQNSPCLSTDLLSFKFISVFISIAVVPQVIICSVYKTVHMTVHVIYK